MEKIQKALGELQSNMVSAALGYCEGKVDYIYIYGKYEGERSGYMFFRIKNKVIQTHKLVEEIDGFKRVNPIKELIFFVDELEKFAKVCEENNHDMPTEFKMKYRVSDGKFENQMKYDEQFTSDDMGSNDIIDKWVEDTTNGEDGFEWD